MKRNMFKTLAGSALISLTALTAGTMAAQAESHMAAGNDTAEVQAFQAATQTLGQAITAAETQLKGKAMSAEFETEDAGAPGFKVEVLLPDGTTQSAMVNASDGTVTAMANDTEDKNSENGDGEEEDNDNN